MEKRKKPLINEVESSARTVEKVFEGAKGLAKSLSRSKQTATVKMDTIEVSIGPQDFSPKYKLIRLIGDHIGLSITVLIIFAVGMIVLGMQLARSGIYIPWSNYGKFVCKTVELCN